MFLLSSTMIFVKVSTVDAGSLDLQSKTALIMTWEKNVQIVEMVLVFKMYLHKR